ncbi:transcription factor 21-like, partial [Sceloporus undulatus]|uniref:transcription factor 21-like n=1 Tax=Sceloporus undulatus TaxID=8520 RepID=UPI001C4C49C4
MSTGSQSDAEDLPEGAAERRLSGMDPDPGPAPAPPPPTEGPGLGSLERRRARGPPGKGRRRGPGGKPGLGAPSSSSSSSSPPSEGGKQVQRHAANARERARMRVLSKAFSRLKTTLPWVPPDTKLSKLDTLRLASSYIAHLRQLLASDKHEAHGAYSHPISL